MTGSDRDQQYASARHRALGFLGRREHAARELAFKLRHGRAAAELEPSLIEQVVGDLAAAGLQSDARYADMMARHRCGQAHGPIKLRAELRRWGVDLTAADSLAELDWFDACERALRKRFGDDAPDDHKQRMRRQRYLAGRGFEREHIDHALAALRVEQD